jgi:hypothetical protein
MRPNGPDCRAARRPCSTPATPAHLGAGAAPAVDEQRQVAAQRRLDAQRVAGAHPVLCGGARELPEGGGVGSGAARVSKVGLRLRSACPQRARSHGSGRPCGRRGSLDRGWTADPWLRRSDIDTARLGVPRSPASGPAPPRPAARAPARPPGRAPSTRPSRPAPPAPPARRRPPPPRPPPPPRRGPRGGGCGRAAPTAPRARARGPPRRRRRWSGGRPGGTRPAARLARRGADGWMDGWADEGVCWPGEAGG